MGAALLIGDTGDSPPEESRLCPPGHRSWGGGEGRAGCGGALAQPGKAPNSFGRARSWGGGGPCWKETSDSPAAPCGPATPFLLSWRFSALPRLPSVRSFCRSAAGPSLRPAPGRWTRSPQCPRSPRGHHPQLRPRPRGGPAPAAEGPGEGGRGMERGETGLEDLGGDGERKGPGSPAPAPLPGTEPGPEWGVPTRGRLPRPAVLVPRPPPRAQLRLAHGLAQLPPSEPRRCTLQPGVASPRPRRRWVSPGPRVCIFPPPSISAPALGRVSPRISISAPALRYEQAIG